MTMDPQQPKKEFTASLRAIMENRGTTRDLHFVKIQAQVIEKVAKQELELEQHTSTPEVQGAPVIEPGQSTQLTAQAFLDGVPNFVAEGVAAGALPDQIAQAVIRAAAMVKRQGPDAAQTMLVTPQKDAQGQVQAQTGTQAAAPQQSGPKI